MRFAAALILISTVFYSSIAGADGDPGLNPFLAKSYDETRDVALHILERFPPDQYWYVGLGRSPTPITAFLELLGVDGITTLPLSGMKSFDGYKDLPKAELRSRLYSHFDSWLPSAMDLDNRKLLLIDYASTGEGLVTAMREARSFAELHRPGTEIVSLGLFRMEKTKEALLANQIIPLQVPEAMGDAMVYSAFDKVAKMQSWHPWDDTRASLTTRPEHQAFKDFLSEQMARDRILQRFTQNRTSIIQSRVQFDCLSKHLRTLLKK
ncbi:MAG: hypothetical protein A2603_03210 [Bdellovibrionales bacterium RIFOXYD1_FULL_55_31]|nr:MAG: hypothetical protein A2603_03210 [Bdellovibrionales bacterium RIFOXYD1_FULL_55_31]